MPQNTSIPGAWNDSWDSPDPAIHEFDVSFPGAASPHFTPSHGGFYEYYEALLSIDEVPPPYIPRTKAIHESNTNNHSVQRRDSGYEDIESFPTTDCPEFLEYLDSSDDDATVQDNPPPTVIAVFGQTGTGKTSLIKAVTGKDLQVGHDLTSYTEAVLAVPCRISGKNVVLVDSPGFSNTNLSDTEILGRIAAWMEENNDEGLLLSGIIYLHRVTDIRMEGPSLKNKELCGEGSLVNAVLATTIWEKVSEEEGARREEEELKQRFWKDMIDYGSTVRRIMTGRADDARALVKSMLNNRPTSTRLQEELRDGKTLNQTEAEIEIRNEPAGLEQKLKEEHRLEMKELKEAQNQHQELEKQIRAEMEETAHRFARLEAESKELKTLTPKRLPKCKRKGFFGTGRYRCLYCKNRQTHQSGRWTCPGCKNTQLNEF